MYIFDLMTLADLQTAIDTLKPLTAFEIDYDVLTIKVQGDMYRDILSRTLDEGNIQYGLDSFD